MPSTAGSSVQRPFVLFMIPPPLMFVIAFGAGALIQRFAPFPSADWDAGAYGAGLVLLGLGVCLALSLAGTFLTRRTTLNPFAKPSTFFARGPYRFSRNPMYLSLILTYLGGSLMFGSVWPLLTLLVPVAILSRIVIPFEEAKMLSAFGDGYQAYCARVRRWI